METKLYNTPLSKKPVSKQEFFKMRSTVASGLYLFYICKHRILLFKSKGLPRLALTDSDKWDKSAHAKCYLYQK